MNSIRQILDQHDELREYLYIRGFLITDDSRISGDGYPFYGQWQCENHGEFYFWIHPKTSMYTLDRNGKTFFLLGHAYNPFSMEYKETEILNQIEKAYNESMTSVLELCDELTGIFMLGFFENHNITVLLDASGMQYGCYGSVGKEVYISSHMRLVGDFCNLAEDVYVNRLVKYRWYHFMMGNYLPGDITCFKEFKRIIPNTYVTYKGGEWEITRFYPNKEIAMCHTDKEYHEVINEACRIMKNTMLLIPRKWKRPAISLTGGIDSNTTFAAANGVYEKYETFSYISMYRESVDAKYAAEISKRFNVPHVDYVIPELNEEVPNFKQFKAILEHNHGDIGSYSDSDIRKKIVLINNNVCDVEVKSWISETIRAYAYKYFGRESFPKTLRPRNYTSLYKIFLMNRWLALKTDIYFADYIKRTSLKKHMFNYDESDFFVWEMMHGGKCGLDIGVMKACFDITIPYNNRKLLDLLLRVSLKDRLSDQHHMDMKRQMNENLYDMNIRVINLNETDLRKKMANMYYTLHSLIPF